MKIKYLLLVLLLGSCSGQRYAYRAMFGYQRAPMIDHTKGSYPGKWKKEPTPKIGALFPMGYYAQKPVN